MKLKNQKIRHFFKFWRYIQRDKLRQLDKFQLKESQKLLTYLYGILTLKK